jgi:hypothetical protein
LTGFGSRFFVYFSFATVRRLEPSGVKHYVLRANTGPCAPFGMSSFHRKRLAVPVSANASYWIRNFILQKKMSVARDWSCRYLDFLLALSSH